MTEDIQNWLGALELEHLTPLFEENQVTMRDLVLLSDDDLKELGIALGPRRRLLKAIAELSSADAPPVSSTVTETKDSPGAERRQLTLMFVDMVGSTELSARLDPEDLREVMRRYQDTVAGAVTRYNGHVAKYLGDGVLAYFGWPVAYEDQAERAIRAALDAVKVVGELASGIDSTLAARAGIATGEVVIGDLGSEVHNESDVVSGETPNLAARLQQMAEPGQLCIDKTTRGLIGRTFELERQDRREIKGFDTPVAVWRVLRERPAESRFETARRGNMMPLIGRDRELDLLLDRWHQASSGDGQVVLLSGEPGIGKSRLVQALQDAVADDDHFRLRYQCSPFHTSSALYPIIRQLERAAGIRSNDEVGERFEKLEDVMRRVAEPEQEALALLASLLSLPYESRYGRLDMTAEQRRERTLVVMQDELRRLAAVKPVLFLFEDAHWIDPSSQQLLAQIIGLIADTPVLMLLTYRPEQPPELPSPAYVTKLQLNRLGRADVEELIQAVAGTGVEAELVAAVASRTDGVPLFIEEMVRSLVEGGYETGRIGAIPSTLQDSLLARLDQLAPEAREVAQIGAVIGREFDKNLLAMVMKRPTGRLDAAFDALLASQLLLPGPSRDTVVFKHALIQDAAYRSLLSRRRRHYHARIAAVLKDNVPEAEHQPELIAHHYTEAGEGERAVEFWSQASKNARERFANLELAQYLERGIAACQDIADPDRRKRMSYPLRIQLGEVLVQMGRNLECQRSFNVACTEAKELGDAAGMVRAAGALIKSHLWTGVFDYESSYQLLADALPRLGEEQREERCIALQTLAVGCLMRGEADKAEAFNRQAVDLARKLENKRPLIDALSMWGQLGISYLARPAAVAERQKLISEVRSYVEEMNDIELQMQVSNWNCYAGLEAGDRGVLGKHLDTWEAAARKYQLRHHLYLAVVARVIECVLSGDFEAAAQAANKALEIGQAFLADQAPGIYGTQMFTIQRERGRLREVAPMFKHIMAQPSADTVWRPGFVLIACDLDMLKEARRTFDELAESGFDFPVDGKTSTVLAYLSEACAKLGDARAAELLYERLSVYREMTITLGLVTMCYGAASRYLGLLSECMEDWTQAESEFEAALAMNRRLEALPWLAHTQHDYARMLRRRGRNKDLGKAEKLLSEAWQSAESLGMVALRERIKSLSH